MILPGCGDTDVIFNAKSCDDCPGGTTFIKSEGICTGCTIDGYPITSEHHAGLLKPPAKFCLESTPMLIGKIGNNMWTYN